MDRKLVKSVGAFGGGIASTGRVCGILLGGVALISSLLSRGEPEERDDPRMWRLSYKFNQRFETLTEPFGGVECKDIARVDWKDREAVKAFYGSPLSRRRLCADLVGEAAVSLMELIEEAGLQQRPASG